MSTDPVVVGIDWPLETAAQLMDVHAVSGLPVCDWSGFLAGVLTRSDIIRARTSPALWSSFETLVARDVMTKPALTATREMRLEEAAAIMERESIHRLVVVADDGESPIGVISLSDLVPWIATDGQRERSSMTESTLA
jgi:CBS domain-containing protein